MNHIGISSTAISKFAKCYEQPIALPPLNVQEVTEEELIGIAATTIRPKLVAVVLTLGTRIERSARQKCPSGSNNGATIVLTSYC